MELLSYNELLNLEAAALRIGLGAHDRRLVLLARLPQELIDSLPVFARPADQLRSDLNELNRMPQVIALDTPPLVIWLDNAIALAYPKPEVALFERARDTLLLVRRGVASEDERELRSRRELMQTCLDLLAHTRSYREAKVGPLFLHPEIYRERRDRQVQIQNYDKALADFVRRFGTTRTHEIRFIFTLTERYRTKIESYIHPDERRQFQDAMLEAIDELWGAEGERGPDICCKHPGILHIQLIFDSAVVTTYRPSEMTPTSGGTVCYRSEVVERERGWFDTFFDNSSRGQQEELSILRQYMRDLW